MRKPLLLLCAALAACSTPGAKKTPLAANEYESGGFLVEENVGPGYIAQTTVIVADAASKEAYEALIEILAGRRTRHAARLALIGQWVTTVDEYVEGRRKTERANREDYAKTHPGEEYPFLPTDFAALKAKLDAKVRGRRGYILRYVPTSKELPRPRLQARAAAPAAPLPQILPPAPPAPARELEEPPSSRPLSARQRESMQLYLEGVIYYQKGDYEKARERWTASAGLDPQNDDPKAGLARIKKLYGE